eukprot:TRINITY_DN7555_c0_g1_i2.p1 TRINITY_DN7555_c0_g1~~TRINITY_DN7555_c0_g1_i2.p1  ORF type:complete len:385 (-),score=51.57 TRINITY_DN7555_c0_g1_i2:64-1218(-)
MFKTFNQFRSVSSHQRISYKSNKQIGFVKFLQTSSYSSMELSTEGPVAAKGQSILNIEQSMSMNFRSQLKNLKSWNSGDLLRTNLVTKLGCDDFLFLIRKTLEQERPFLASEAFKHVINLKYKIPPDDFHELIVRLKLWGKFYFTADLFIAYAKIHPMSIALKTISVMVNWATSYLKPTRNEKVAVFNELQQTCVKLSKRSKLLNEHKKLERINTPMTKKRRNIRHSLTSIQKDVKTLRLSQIINIILLYENEPKSLDEVVDIIRSNFFESAEGTKLSNTLSKQCYEYFNSNLCRTKDTHSRLIKWWFYQSPTRGLHTFVEKIKKVERPTNGSSSSSSSRHSSTKSSALVRNHMKSTYQQLMTEKIIKFRQGTPRVDIRFELKK